MNRIARLILGMSTVALLFATTQFIAAADSFNLTANRVLGQPDLDSGLANNAGLANQNQRMELPRSINIDKSTGRLYLADAGSGSSSVNDRIMSWPNASSFTNGQAADIIFHADGLSQTLNAPSQAAVDSSGNLYIVDTGNNRVLKFPSTVSGTVATVVLGQSDFGGNLGNDPTAGPETLNAPQGLAIDSNNNLFVADSFNHRILKYNAPITTHMSASLVIGHKFFTQTLFATPPTSVTLNGPNGIAFDASGNLYVADTFNNRVLEYTLPFTNGMAAYRVLGQADFNSKASGAGANGLNFPYGLAVDYLRRVYVADQANNRVLMYSAIITNNAAAIEVFGQPNFVSKTQNYADFNPHAYNLFNPWGVAVDSSLNVYISDSGNNRVLEYDKPNRILILPLIKR